MNPAQMKQAKTRANFNQTPHRGESQSGRGRKVNHGGRNPAGAVSTQEKRNDMR